MLKRLFSTSRTLKVNPPVHFPEPQPHSKPSTTHDNQLNSPVHSTPNSSILNVALGFMFITVSFFAIDNYVNRVKLEKTVNDTVLLNLKTLSNQQTNFANATKRKNLLVINERRENNRKLAKLSIHIALLRRQLEELGHLPATIDEALRKFDEAVKSNTSIFNVTDQILYVSDDSELKSFLPSIHDYERQGKQ